MYCIGSVNYSLNSYAVGKMSGGSRVDLLSHAFTLWLAAMIIFTWKNLDHSILCEKEFVIM